MILGKRIASIPKPADMPFSRKVKLRSIGTIKRIEKFVWNSLNKFII